MYFIAELYKVGVVSDLVLHECMRTLLRSSTDEESLEEAVILFSVAGRHMEKHGANVSNISYTIAARD